jgi:hypothetical protein
MKRYADAQQLYSAKFARLHPLQLPCILTLLRELRLLIRSLHGLRIPQSIAIVKLHRNLVIRSTAIQAARLDARHIRHDLQFRIQAAAAGGTEPMFVYFSGLPYGVIIFGRALGNFEVGTWDDYVGGIGCTGPLLAVGAWREANGLVLRD